MSMWGMCVVSDEVYAGERCAHCARPAAIRVATALTCLSCAGIALQDFLYRREEYRKSIRKVWDR